MITIVDGQTDRILDDIPEELFWNDKHYKSLKDTLETFDFTTFADRPFSVHLTKMNRVIIPDEDGQFIEFIIHNTRKYRSPEGSLLVDVYTSASYTELKTAKVIRPQKVESRTAEQHVDFALEGTEWEKGWVDYAGIRTITIENYTNPYSYIKTVASTLGLEPRFRIETDENQVAHRYVDLVKHVGEWQGREVEFGKDLLGIERIEDTSNVVTALLGLGPEREDGTRLEVFVEDKEALARWGRNGQHIIDVYEPQSVDAEMTESRLRELTQNELEKRVNSVVEYVSDIADLEKVPGLEHEKIRFGDTIKIKDTGFNPPLYLEARVHTQERSIKKNGRKTVVLGDYIEYTEEEVMAIWKSLKAEIAKKVSMSDVMEVVYTKSEVDSKDAGVYRDSTHYADNVSETKKQEAIQAAAADATNKANTAEQNAKNHADTVAEQKKQEAIQQAVADAETKINTAKTELEADIALKADAEWVNGQLVLKENAITKSNTAPVNPTAGQLWLDTSVTPNVLKRWDGSAWVKATPTSAGEVGAYTKTEVDNALNSKVSVTQYTADMNGVVDRLDSAESRITQNENEIATKVSHTQYQQDQEDLSSQLSQMSTQIQQQADQIALKANKTDVYTKTQVDEELGKKVDTTVYNQKIGELTTSIDGISANVSNLQTTVGQHGTSISNLQSQVSIHAGQIASKVDATYVQGAIADIEIGGRNLVLGSDVFITSGSKAFDFVNDLKDLRGKTVTLSVYVELKNVGFTGTDTQRRIGFEPSLVFEDGTVLHLGVWYYPKEGESFKGRIARTITIPDKEISRTVQKSIYIQNLSGDNKVGRPKIEIGNKATDWTPAPEDTQDEMDKKIDDIKVGGRNLVIRRNELKDKWINIEGNISDQQGHAVMEGYISVTPNEVLTFTKTDSELASDGGFWRWRWFDAEKNYIARTADQRNEFQWIVPEDTYFIQVSYPMDVFPKIERGNKATDWTPAPEDVQANIDDVYQYASSEIQQLAGQVSTKAEASTVTALGSRVTKAENNISALRGEITTKVSKTDYNGETIVSLIHQTAEQVTISANKINFRGHVFGEDATFTGHLQGASGTFGQVSVNDGDFSLRESSSGLEQSIIAKENLIMDHSFEMLVGHGDFDYNYFWYEYDFEQPDNKRHAYWISVGAPKIGVYLPSPNVNTVSFGMQNVCVNLNNYVYQDVEAYKLEAGATYTISAFFRRQRNTTAGARPRIRLRFMDLADQIVLWDGGITTFDAVPSNYNHVRYAKTFTLPKSLENEMIMTRGLRIDIQTTDGKWVAVDGVQLVKNDKPVIYDPETSFFQLISGQLGYGFNGGIRFNNSAGAEFDKYGNLQAPTTASTRASWNIKDFYGDVVFSVPWGGTTQGLPVEIHRDLRTTGIVYTPAVTFTSITLAPTNREGSIWYGDGWQGKGLYVCYESGWRRLQNI